MPQIQMPPIVPAGEHSERGIVGLQNAMLTNSRLKSAAIEQGEQQRQIQKRNELEQLLLRTPEPDRDRAGLEWAKVNDLDLYGKLTALHVNKLQQGLTVNPEHAAAKFERATGEKLDFDPMRGVHLVDMQDGSKIAISARGVEKFDPPKPERPTIVSPGSGVIEPGKQTPSYTQPFKPETERPDQSLSAVELFNQDPQKYAAMREIDAKMAAKYRTLEGSGPSASQELQAKRLRKSIKDKKDRALAALEREYRSPAAFGRFEAMSDDELLQRKQQIQDDFENDLTAAGFEATPFSYSGQLRPSQPLSATPRTGGITREQALQELRRRGVVR